MTRPVTVYRWDDAGAPQRSPANAEAIVNILKKCLVEGYGAKAPLGWTLEYEDAPNAVAVFRNSPVNGSGGYFRIRPYNIPTNAYIYTQSAMAATGANPEDLFNPGYLNSIPTDASLTRWVLVGDDVSFYLILHNTTINYNTTVPEIAMFFGDFVSIVPTDNARFICLGANNNSTSSALTVNHTSNNLGAISASSGRQESLNSKFSGDSTRHRIALPTSVDGTLAYKNYLVYAPVDTPDSVISNATITDIPAGGILTNLFLKLDDNVTQARMIDTDAPFIRGYIPGIVTLGWKTHYSAIWPAFKNINGKEHLGIAVNSQSSSYGGVQLWLNTEDWG